MNALLMGTFDPFHNGHYELLQQASRLFNVYVAITENPKKSRRYDVDKCAKIIKTLTSNVFITEDYLGLDIISKYNCMYVVRGIRDEKDFTYENNLAEMYRSILPQINILYIKTHTDLSSTFVYKELKEGKDISIYLPYNVKLLEDVCA